ncbi:MAG: site-specific DNA-methyltransferase, partial [Chloroflexota bacterium]
MPDGKTIKLTPAKGRPMLQWVGKRPLERVTAFPAQLVEKFAPTPGTPGEGLLFHGDNKDVLAWLLANGYRGKVNLVY